MAQRISPCYVISLSISYAKMRAPNSGFTTNDSRLAGMTRILLTSSLDTLFSAIALQSAEELRQYPHVPLVFLERVFVLRVPFQVRVRPLGKGKPLPLSFVEIFLQRVAVFILRSLGTCCLQRVPCWPDTPDPFPVFQPDVVGPGPFPRGLLVASLIRDASQSVSLPCSPPVWISGLNCDGHAHASCVVMGGGLPRPPSLVMVLLH